MSKKMNLQERIQARGFTAREARWIYSIYFDMWDDLDENRECVMLLNILMDSVRWSHKVK